MNPTSDRHGRARRGRLSRLARAAAIAGAMALSGATAQGVGAPFPAMELRDADGVLVRTADLEGSVWLVNVWASWCPPCQAELPLLQRAVSELESEGLGLLLINTTETASVASAFLEAEGLELRTLVDPDRREAGLEPVIGVLRRLRTAGLPTTYFLAEDGRLLATYVGELTPDVLAERLATVFGLDWEP
jgi:cytochrome c biogenesis protein CcmG, thiol:disulfide interchange protein DsbE